MRFHGVDAHTDGISWDGSKKKAGESRTAQWLEDAGDLLHARFSEPQNLVGIAEAVGVHPVHLAREFRKQFHCTVGEYVRRLRVEYACRELSASDAPLADIASARIRWFADSFIEVPVRR